MRKIIVVMLLLGMSACAECAIDFRVPVNADNPMFELDDGLTVEFCGVVRDLKAAGNVRDCVFSLFLVTAEKDMQLTVKSDAFYDSFGRKLPGPVGVSVAGNKVPSEIIAEVPTLVWVVHRVPVSVRELPKFSRMKFWFNDKEVELRGKASQEWEDWKDTTGASNEALAVWLETSPTVTDMYSAIGNVPDFNSMETFGGHHFKVFYAKVTWTEAKKICEDMGGHLATSTSAEKNAFLVSLMKNNVKGLLIGGTDEGSEGIWRWVNGEAWKYTNWDRGEPNNSGGREHYLEIYNNAFWNDATHTAIYGYICEWDY